MPLCSCVRGLFLTPVLVVSPLPAQAPQQPLPPVPQIIKDVNEISDGSGNNPGRTPGAPRRTASSFPGELCLVGADCIDFAATSNVYGRELWSYQPSTAPQPWCTDLVPATAIPNGPTVSATLSSDPCMLTPVGSKLLFLTAKTCLGADQVYLITATDVIPVILDPSNPGHVQDIAPMGGGAVVATFAGTTTTFWRVGADGKAQNLFASTDYKLVGDLIDCNYDGGGFLAFTSRDKDSLSNRLLVALSSKGPPASTVLSDDVEEFVPLGSALFFTRVTQNSTELYVKRGGEAAEMVTSDGTGITHLMAAADASGAPCLYFLTGAAGTNNWMYRCNADGVQTQLPWQDSVFVRSVTAAVLIPNTAQGVPHVLGLGKAGTDFFWGIWKAAAGGTTMAKVAQLDDHWSDCSSLAGNGTGKLAFFGRWYASNAELRAPCLGFVTGTSEVKPPVLIPGLRIGARPTSLLALPDRVVFVAEHRQLGIEPWYCLFP